MIVNERNTLSADCVLSSSIKMFKNIIYNYLVREGHTYCKMFILCMLGSQ